MRKKILNLMIISLILIFGAINVNAFDKPLLKTTLLRYEPIPAQPGNYVTVYVQIENSGSGDAQSASIRFKEGYPFSLDNSDDIEHLIGTLQTGQSYVTDFKIRVDEDAVEGENEIKFEVNSNTKFDEYNEKSFLINIQTQDENVAITEIKQDPKEAEPGKTTKVEIKVKNTADSTIEDLSMKISTTKTVSGTETDLPFAMKNSISENTIDRLSSGEETTFNYEIISYPTVSSGIYKLPIEITFYDGTGEEITKTDYLTLIVNPDVKLDLIIDDTDLTKEKKSGEISLKLINRGYGDIKFANLEIKENEDFDLLSQNKLLYIGNIDSDDYESSDIKINAKKDNIKIPISLEYRDSLNNIYTLEKELELDLASNAELGVKKSNSNIYLIVGVGLVMIFFIYRHFKKKKKRK